MRSNGGTSQRIRVAALLFLGSSLVVGQTSSIAEIDVAGALMTSPKQINNLWQIVGDYEDSSLHIHGFVRNVDGTLTLIDYPSAVTTSFSGINDAGTAVGYFQLADQKYHGLVRTSAGQFTQIDYPAAIHTRLYGINNAGTMVGAYDDTNGVRHGFVRDTSGQFMSMDAPGGLPGASTTIWAINNNGTIAFSYTNPAPYPQNCGASYIQKTGESPVTIATASCWSEFNSVTIGPVALSDVDVAIANSRVCMNSSCEVKSTMLSAAGQIVPISFSHIAGTSRDARFWYIGGLNVGGGRSGSFQFDTGEPWHGFITQTCGPNTVNPISFHFDAFGASGSISVTTTPGCVWDAGFSDPWLYRDINDYGTSVPVFSGSGTFRFAVMPNTTSVSRTGTITIAGQHVSVTQDAGGCSYRLSGSDDPTAVVVRAIGPAAANSVVASVSTQDGCPWTASTTADWLTITTPSGNGPGSVNISVTSNPSVSQTRAAILSIAGMTVKVIQQAAISVGATLVPLPPCRLLDTRQTPLAFSHLPWASSTATVPVSGKCNIAADVTAVVLNATVVPLGPLGFVTLWPSGGPIPVVSTLNSLDGRIVANGAIVPVGPDGAISVFASYPTDLVLDVTGYFSPTANGLRFVPIPKPCRAVDTRLPAGPFGGPALSIATPARDFALPTSSCAVSAEAYIANFTAVPNGGLAFLTAWPTGSNRPNTSILNSLDGDIVANTAIVPGGAGNAISVFAAVGANTSTNVVIDLFGYFTTPSAQASYSKFYPVVPCRILDTRGHPDAGFGPPSLQGSQPREVQLTNSSCGVPPAAGYSLNITAIPHGPLPYLSVYPKPVSAASTNATSLLNSLKGRIVANSVILPGSLGVVLQANQPDNQTTDVVIDINGYFNP